MTAFTIRDLTAQEDFRACVRLQQRVWGDDFTELVPPAIQWVAARTGGIIAGAFDAEARMLGFLFGITGFVDARPLHWSDMLAVVPEARGLGIGTALKRYQRTQLLARGVLDVRWTFDPLESRNAWLNFNHLGIVVREYIRDCYGAPTSPLHAGLGTDRVVAEWRLDSDRVRQRMDGPAPAPDTTQADAPAGQAEAANPGAPDEARVREDLAGPAIRIRIPSDIQSLKRVDPVAAAVWRASTRAAFETYFGRGYEAVDVRREGDETTWLLLRPGG